MTFDFEIDGQPRAEDNYSVVACITKDDRIIKNSTATIQAQKREVGHVVVQVDKGKRIFYLITKDSVNGRLTCENLKQCLQELRMTCEKQGVTRLIVPDTLRAGKEGISEKTVMDCLFTVFEGWQGKMIMCHMKNDTIRSRSTDTGNTPSILCELLR